MKKLAFILLALLFWLQYKIWFQDGGVPEVLELQQEVNGVKTKVNQLEERNQSLQAEVRDLKKGLRAVEERARSELGMIKKGEVYYQVIEPDKKNKVATEKKNEGKPVSKMLPAHK